MKSRLTYICLALLFFICSCGGGRYSTATSAGSVETSIETPWGHVTVTRDAFLFGGTYPADIVIPDSDGMQSTAFVASTLNPSGVIAIDLDARPYALSQTFATFLAPAGTGIPSSLYIQSTTEAYLLTSSHLIIYNPTSGALIQTLSVSDPVDLTSPHAISDPFDTDNDGQPETTVSTVTPAYPASVIGVGSTIWVSSANYLSPVQPAIAAPGTIQIFGKSNDQWQRITTIITSGYNPTAMVHIDSDTVAIVNSGVSDLSDGGSTPTSSSRIDLVDTTTFAITATIDAGMSALAFRTPSLTSDGRLFLTSSSFGETFMADLVSLTLPYSHDNPITITSNTPGSDFLTDSELTVDDHYLFVSSFNHSTITAIDISGDLPIVNPPAFPTPIQIGFDGGVSAENPTGSPTGIGALTRRPGIPDVDFSGPDLFAITGNPGTLVAINTRGSDDNPPTSISSFTIEPDAVTLDANATSSPLTATITLADGTVLSGLTDSFVHPATGYPLTILWQSDDSTIVTVSPTGFVTAIAPGSTTVRAIIGTLSATIDIIVSPLESENLPPPSPPPPPSTANVLMLKPPFKRPKKPTVSPIILQFGEDPILSEPPAGATAFADSVLNFSTGDKSGFGATYFPTNVLGAPNGFGETSGNNQPSHVLSLGCGGSIVLAMDDYWIADGDGPDFIVFENAFKSGNAIFSEPAEVAVSSDGAHWKTFSCNAATKPYEGCAGTHPVLSSPTNGIDPTDPTVAGGDPFDLSDVGMTLAKFIRITDKTPAGSCTAINGTAGFDLDAVSVVWGYAP